MRGKRFARDPNISTKTKEYDFEEPTCQEHVLFDHRFDLHYDGFTDSVHGELRRESVSFAYRLFEVYSILAIKRGRVHR